MSFSGSCAKPRTLIDGKNENLYVTMYVLKNLVNFDFNSSEKSPVKVAFFKSRAWRAGHTAEYGPLN